MVMSYPLSALSSLCQSWHMHTVYVRRIWFLSGFLCMVSRLDQLWNNLQNVQRLVSDRTWLQQLGEEHCTLVKSLSRISEHGDNLGVRLQCCTAMKSSDVQRRVRDSSGGSEGSGILVDIQTEGNTWLGDTVLILWRCTGLVMENVAE